MNSNVLGYKGFPCFLEYGLYLKVVKDKCVASYHFPRNYGNWSIDARILDNWRVVLVSDNEYTSHLNGEIANGVSEVEYRKLFNNKPTLSLTGESFINNILSHAEMIKNNRIMKHYIGTKQVEAEFMCKGEAYENGLLKAGVVPSEEESSIIGYHVRYKDGYESWSPKGVFERAYQASETPLDRMLIEQNELEDRISRLHVFVNSDKFKELDKVTQAMLVSQLQTMRDYDNAIRMRSTKMESGEGSYNGFSFGVATTLLTAGFCVRRTGWNGKGLFVCKQVPAHITSDIIPKMQSLPQAAKDRILDGKGFVDYTSQCLIYNENTGRADSWVPSISDVFADDWELVV